MIFSLSVLPEAITLEAPDNSIESFDTSMSSIIPLDAPEKYNLISSSLVNPDKVTFAAPVNYYKSDLSSGKSIRIITLLIIKYKGEL